MESRNSGLGFFDNLHTCIYNDEYFLKQYIQENNRRLVQLCVLKLNDDVLHFLDLFAMVLSSSTRFAKTSKNSDYVLN